MNWMKKAGRRVALAAIVVVAAAPAAAVEGLQRVFATTETDSLSPKTVTAVCPEERPQVVGGGGWAFAIDEAEAHQVVLTRLQPINGRLDSYVASAEEPAGGISGSWWLEAYAICASGVAGHQIVRQTTHPASPPFVATATRCPSGKVVMGTGSGIFNSGGRVGLQLSRASGPLDISRSTARERAGGYVNDWTLTSYAICANPAGLTAEAHLSNKQGGGFQCGAGMVHSVGGGGSLVDSGPFFLQVVYPFFNLLKFQVFMTGAPPDGLVIQAICGPGTVGGPEPASCPAGEKGCSVLRFGQ